jgi:formylglycine-generating enzyme required for sulfatase activity
MPLSRDECPLFIQAILILACIATAGGWAAEKSPVPDEAAQQAARKMAGEIYGGRFALAKTATDKTALAAEMIEAALKVQDGSPGQFVLLSIARDIASGAGDAPTALQAVEELVQRFESPAAALAAETLRGAAQHASATAQRRAVAESAGSVIARLVEADEYELAIRVCEAARDAAHRAREFKLAAEVAAQLPELRRMHEQSQAYREALAFMDDDPTQPAANLAAGRYLCFVKGNWDRGVAMLALGSDEPLKAVALMELRGAASADEQVAIGDAWWDVAEAQQGDERNALRLRAGFWYRQAEPAVAGGLEGLKIKQRLETIAKLDREIPGAPPPAPPAKPQPPPLAIAPFDEKTAKQHQAAWAKHLNVPVLWTNSIGMRFALIPPGEFDMGSTEEEVARLLDGVHAQKEREWYVQLLPSEVSKHRVRITRPYYMGIYEVTQAEYERVMGTNPSHFTGNPIRPVEQVSWSDAVEFCRRLSEDPKEKAAGAVYRLPTEAEWEYACRAGTTTRFSFGDDAGVLAQYAWWLKNSQDSTQPVGQLRPNAFGLFDVHGNVWEWCADWHAGDYYRHAPTEDPIGPNSGSSRVMRSGSYRLDDPLIFRSAFRGRNRPERRLSDWGFRVARTLTP